MVSLRFQQDSPGRKFVDFLSEKHLVWGVFILKGFAPCRRPPLYQNGVHQSYIGMSGRRLDDIRERHARAAGDEQNIPRF